MSAKLFRFPSGVAKPDVAPIIHFSTEAAAFRPGDKVTLKVTGAAGEIAEVEMGLIQCGADLVLVWRYAVRFAQVRLVGFLAGELERA